MKVSAVRIGLVGLLAACAPNVPRGLVPWAVAEAPAVRIVRPDAAASEVELWAAVKAGSGFDPIGREGVAWLTARAAVSGGAGGRDGEAVRDALAGWGGVLTVEVGKELAVFGLRCPTAAAEGCVGLFVDLLAAPRFADDAIAAEAEVARARLTDPEPGWAACEALDAWTFAGRAYGHPVPGRYGVVEGLGASVVRDFHRTHYLRSAVVVGLGGAFPAGLADTLGTALDGLRVGLPPDRPMSRPQVVNAADRAWWLGPSDTTAAWMGGPVAVTIDHPDREALGLALSAFGAAGGGRGGFASACDGGAVLEGSGRWLGERAAASWSVAVPDGDVAAALRRLTAWRADGVPAELLAAARARRTAVVDGLRAAVVARALGADEAAGAAPTDAEVDAALQQHLLPDGLRMVGVGEVAWPAGVVAREVEAGALFR